MGTPARLSGLSQEPGETSPVLVLRPLKPGDPAPAGPALTPPSAPGAPGVSSSCALDEPGSLLGVKGTLKEGD